VTAARPLRRSAENPALRVLEGRRLKRLTLAPWTIMVVIGVIAFLGLGFARTSLDRSAFELDRLNRSIAEQEAINEQLRLEIARMENPARIAPLAEEMGLVIPANTPQLLVDLDDGGPAVVSVDDGEATQ
jgi:cell division protein FtsL